MNDPNDIPSEIRCNKCLGYGITERHETIIGAGWLLEAGKAYLNRNELICAHCKGSGIDPDKYRVEDGVVHYNPSPITDQKTTS